MKHSLVVFLEAKMRDRQLWWIIVPLLVFSSGSGSIRWPLVEASSGDRLPTFGRCVRELLALPVDQEPLLQSSWTERLTRWSPQDQAKYHCMHQCTQESAAAGNGKVHQFFGKWPFIRFLGCQEPASVLFSLMNLYAHAR